MNVFIYSSILFLFSVSTFAIEEETVFELKREKIKKPLKAKKKKTIPLKFKRQSFSYSDDFMVFNEIPKSHIKKGTVLRVNIPYPIIASFSEEFPIYGIITSPFRGILSGKIKGVSNTNKSLIVFDEVILNGELQKVKSFPVFINGDLKESFFKDIALNFFESLPSVLAIALRSQIPQHQIHFINTDLRGKVSNLSSVATEKRKLTQYVEIKNIELFNVIIK